jgi:hypothetical protein
MTLQLTLPAELDNRLRKEAERQGLTPEAFALKLLEQHLPMNERSAILSELFEQWQAEDEATPEADSDYDFFQALDAAHTSNRKLFPPELGAAPRL